MLLTEWNQDEAIEVAREEAWEDGHEDGLEEGIEKERQYFLDLLNQGLTVEEIRERLQQEDSH